MATPVSSDQDHGNASRLLNLPAPHDHAEGARGGDAGCFYVTHASSGFVFGQVLEQSGSAFVSTLTEHLFALRGMVVAVDGTAGYVINTGGIVNGLTGLVAGHPYYVTSGGALTLTPTTLRAGYALSATQLYLRLERANEVPIGVQLDFYGHTLPPGFALCSGDLQSGTGNWRALALAIGGIYGTAVRAGVGMGRTVAVTNGSADVTISSSGLAVGSVVFGLWSRFGLTEPGHVSANSMPLVVVYESGTTIRLSQTEAGTALTATSTASGISLQERFALPDARGRVNPGLDVATTALADRLTVAGCGINSAVLGASGGAQTHTLSIPEMPAHTHSTPTNDGNNNATNGTAARPTNSNGVTGSTGGGGAHNNTQPSLICSKMICYA